MKKKTEELDVDFIGGQDKLTKEEEIALVEYFTKRHEVKSKLIRKTPIRTARKVKA